MNPQDYGHLEFQAQSERGHQQKIEIKVSSLKTLGIWNGTTDYLRITYGILKVMITLIDVGLNWSVRSL